MGSAILPAVFGSFFMFFLPTPIIFLHSQKQRFVGHCKALLLITSFGKTPQECDCGEYRRIE